MLIVYCICKTVNAMIKNSYSDRLVIVEELNRAACPLCPIHCSLCIAKPSGCFVNKPANVILAVNAYLLHTPILAVNTYTLSIPRIQRISDDHQKLTLSLITLDVLPLPERNTRQVSPRYKTFVRRTVSSKKCILSKVDIKNLFSAMKRFII